MAKHHRRTRRHRRSRRHSRRHHRGGQATANPGSYSSAATWMNAINGSEDAQYGRVFNQSSPFPPNGNAIIGAQGQRAGRRRRRGRRGGTMMGTAIAPLALIGMNHYYGKRHGTRKH